MRHHGTNGKNDGKWRESLWIYIDERTVKTVAKMGDYASMGERLVLRVIIMYMPVLCSARE